MKMNYVKPGVKVFNKIDRQFYMVKEDFSAYQLDKDDNILEDGRVIPLSTGNVICFRFISDTNPKTVATGYSVRDGVLYLEDAPATEQGEILFEKLLAAFSGYLLLLSRDNKLIIYRILRDRFDVLSSNIPLDTVILSCEPEEGKALLGYNITKAEKRKDEDGNEYEVEVFEESALLVFNNKSVETLDAPAPFNINIPAVRVGYRYIVATNKVVNNGIVEDSEPSIFVIESDEYVDRYNGVDDYTVVESIDDGVFIKTPEKLLKIGTSNDFSYTSEKFNNLAGYDYLVDETRDKNVTVLSLATRDCLNTKTVTITQTPDRGKIITVA